LERQNASTEIPCISGISCLSEPWTTESSRL